MNLCWKKWLAFAIVGLAPVNLCATEPLSVAGQTLERLRSEGVGEWQSMAHKLDYSNFDYTIREIDQKGKTTRVRTKSVSARVVGASFQLTEKLVADDLVSIYARNDRYEFALVRYGDSPWKITWQNSRRDDDSPVGSAYSYLAGMLHLPWSISAIPLEKLVNDSRFSVQSVRPADRDELQIDFSVVPTAEHPDSLQGLKCGSIFLSPARHWAIQRYTAQYANKMSSSLKLSYGPLGPPEIKHAEFALDVSADVRSKFAIDVAKYEWPTIQNAEFTLSAYRLPEFHEPSATRRWLWIVNLGVIFMLSGLIVWRSRRAGS